MSYLKTNTPMVDVQLAVISDIHGNRWALEAVLDDIALRGIRDTVNLGDSLYGPLDPAGTAQILLQLDLPTVRGNEDRIIVEPSQESEHSQTLRYVRESLSPAHLEWLAALGMTIEVDGKFHMCHGSLERDDEYLLQRVTENGLFLRKSHELMAKLRQLEQPILLCGHDHVPRTVYLPHGRLIINPGSVGCPAYTDETPFPHAMETGTPHARYSVVSIGASGRRIENIAVPYDWQAAAATARDNGRPDWEGWLQTGRTDPVRSPH